MAIANDNFANATAVTFDANGKYTAGPIDNSTATMEPGEPTPVLWGSGGGKSLWWTYTPGSSAVSVQVDTIGSTGDTGLAVYTGTAVDALTNIASDDDSGGDGTSKLTFIASPGTTYHIQVAAFASGTMNYVLNVADTHNNDYFATAAEVTLDGTGHYSSASLSNATATMEPGEPLPVGWGSGGGKSLWWTYTPSADATVTVDTIGSTGDTGLAVYTGTAVDALTKIASDDDSGGNTTSKLTFSATADVIYHIQVAAFASGTMNYVLNVAGPLPTQPPPAGPTVQWWDGGTLQPAQIDGWWDGSTEQPVTIKGWWDGSTIQPLA